MKSKVEIITPEMAIEILEKHNPRNRKVSEHTVQSYAADMRNGRWVLNHQGLAFDVNGDLCDGQHRLWAVVFSGKPLETMVTRDLPVSEEKNGIVLNSMDTIDRGRFRQTGQQMQLHGIRSGAATAASCRAIAMLVYPSMAGARISTTNSMLIHELWGKDIEAVMDCMSAGKRRGYLLGPLAMYHHGEPEKARAFANQISTLENLSPQARAFCKYLEISHNSGSHEKTSRILAQCIKNFHEGKEANKVQDCDGGRDFLVGMYPSLAKRVRDAMKPCDTRGVRKMLNRKKGEQPE